MPPSSTSNSDPIGVVSQSAAATEFDPRPLRQALAACLAVFACVVLIDLGMRWWGPFDLYSDWEHPQIALKERQYRKFTRDAPVDALIVGSSVTLNLDARRLSKMVEARVFNGGIAAAKASASRAILDNAYLAHAKPRLVIYGVSARDLRDSGDIFAIAPFLSHKMRAIRAKGWQDRLEVAVERGSYLFRTRRQLRDRVLNGKVNLPKPLHTDAYGSSRHKPGGLVALLKGKQTFPAKFFYRSRYTNYSVDLERGNAHELLAAVEHNRSLGIDTILVNIPIAPAAMSLFENPEADYQSYINTLQTIAERTGAPFYDAHAALTLPNSSFSNADHMAKDGDVKVEEYLAPIISQHLAGPAKAE